MFMFTYWFLFKRYMLDGNLISKWNSIKLSNTDIS